MLPCAAPLARLDYELLGITGWHTHPGMLQSQNGGFRKCPAQAMAVMQRAGPGLWGPRLFLILASSDPSAANNTAGQMLAGTPDVPHSSCWGAAPSQFPWVCVQEEGHQRRGGGAELDTGKMRPERLAEAETHRLCTRIRSLDFIQGLWKATGRFNAEDEMIWFVS